MSVPDPTPTSGLPLTPSRALIRIATMLCRSLKDGGDETARLHQNS